MLVVDGRRTNYPIRASHTTSIIVCVGHSFFSNLNWFVTPSLILLTSKNLFCTHSLLEYAFSP